MATVEGRRKSSRLKNTRRRGEKKKLSEKEAAEATYVPKDLSVRKPCRKLLLEAGKCEREHQFQSIFLKFHCAKFFSTFFFPEVHHH